MYKQEVNGKQLAIYCDVPDPAALAQIYEAMKQTYAVQGAVMPDCHKGYTLCIGGVVATKDVVVPSYVGFDIGCTDKDTEFLTRSGWKKISDYQEEDEIMQYDDELKSCNFAKPLAYIKKPCDEFNHLNNGVVDQAVNDEHKVILFSSRNKTKSVTDTAENLINKTSALKKGVNQLFNCTIPLRESSTSVEYTDTELRLIIAVSADGCLRRDNVIEFHLKKERKIKRLKELCEQLDIEVTEYNLKDGTFGCAINFHPIKDLSFLWGASPSQLKVVIDEVKHWDGHIRKDKGTISYSSIEKNNIDVIQYAYAVCGVRANIQEVDYNKPHQSNWNKSYTLYTTKNAYVQFPKSSDIKRVKSEDGLCYCFTTETGYWIMRRGGKIVITGNCGMCSVKTNIHKDELNDLTQLHQDLHQAIPVGNNTHKEAKPWKFPPHTDVAEKIFNQRKAVFQLGTLGGGNHFLEVGYDEDGYVWITVHSGSRGLGHGIASNYMAVASGTDEAKEGHYPLHVDTQEGKDYIADLNFALEYALSNRKAMVKAALSVLSTHTGKKINEELFINRNHNHAELKDGLWIHRKGATHAEDGMMGVIPGNMRDGVFVVKGKGNTDSLCSSSHGAGRVLGRFKAKKTLDLGKFEKDMEGVVASVGKNTLDEAPDAYKNIFEVMEQQRDLVEVIAYVKPLVSVKG